ncbi:unnamed protein product [Angiostrongylus costaricensis]|uniref:Cnd1 domain-containing protein n=1 Tax=Angiostrongylus costaricensis TaxID=334426 RepID=A0A158PHP3_ANGCS|nr:unnamed protein product [Angiostrongylus costaricensis]
MRNEIEYPPNCLPISTTCGTSDLVKRLKTLSEALQVSDTNDECNRHDRYGPLICHLASACFLENGNKDVQIWLACCLADIFRIFAPNVPLGDPSQLKDVLIFIVRTLRGLDSPSNPLFRRYFYLVENLSVVSTLVLALELPHDEANEVIRTLIKTAMEIANGKEWKNDNREASEEGGASDEGEERSEVRDKVIGFLIGIISTLLRDVDQVSDDILDLLFFYLINPQKLNNRESYNMARQIIHVTQTSLEAAIQSADDDQQRLLATRFVGKLASSEKSRLCDDHPDLWKLYMDRFKDSSAEIREACAKDSHEILLRHSQLRGQISLALGRLTRDLDDPVRLTAVLCIIETAKKKLEAVNESLILACCDRMKDKKPKIRQEVIAKLLHLYFKVVMGDEYTASETAAVTVIPEKALALYMLASMTEEKSMIERYFSSYIIPYKMGIKKRIKSMVDLFCKLDKFESQYVPFILMVRNYVRVLFFLMRRVFAEIVARSSCHRRILREMLDIISRQGSSEDKAQLESKIQRISSTYHDSNGFSIALKHFANLLSTDQKCFEYGEYLVSNEYTTAKVEEICKELIRRSAEVGTIPKDCQTNIRRYIERVAPLIMDQESTNELLRLLVHLKNDAECGNTDAITKLPRLLRLTKIWGEYFPHIFTRMDCIQGLLRIVASDDPNIVEAGLQVLYYITLQSTLKTKDQDWSNVVLSEVWNVITCEDKNFRRCSKLAVRIVCRLLTREECALRFNRIFSDIEERVSLDNPAACINALQVISEFHRNLPLEFGCRVKALITDFIVPGLVLSPETDDGAAESLDPLIPLEERPVSQYCLPKVYGMKLLTRYLFACNGDVENDALASKTIKMFVAFIQAAGDLHDPDKHISLTEKAWLRAVAGVSLLKLCYVQKYSQMMDAGMFATLANLMTDTEDCVRNYFVKRLNKGIMRNRLTIEYLSFFSLVNLVNATGLEENAVKNYRDQCRAFLLSAVTRRRHLIQSSGFSSAYLPYHQPEYTIAYSIWLLSHQPLLTSHSDLANMAALQECLWFMMEPFMAKKETTDFEFIHHLLQYIKATSDALFENRCKGGEIGQAQIIGQNKKMWALADMGVLMLVYRGKVTIRNEPRKPVLSARFFVRSKNAEHLAMVYAPEELIEDEKQRNGKIPTHERRRFLSANTNTSLAKRPGTKNIAGVRKAAGKELDDRNVISSPKNIGDATDDFLPSTSGGQVAARSLRSHPTEQVLRDAKSPTQLKTLLRGRSHNIPLSTSTPMQPISSPSKVKAIDKKVGKRSQTLTADDHEKPKAKRKADVAKVRERSHKPNAPSRSGALSRSEAARKMKRKTSSDPVRVIRTRRSKLP